MCSRTQIFVVFFLTPFEFCLAATHTKQPFFSRFFFLPQTKHLLSLSYHRVSIPSHRLRSPPTQQLRSSCLHPLRFQQRRFPPLFTVALLFHLCEVGHCGGEVIFCRRCTCWDVVVKEFEAKPPCCAALYAVLFSVLACGVRVSSSHPTNILSWVHTPCSSIASYCACIVYTSFPTIPLSSHYLVKASLAFLILLLLVGLVSFNFVLNYMGL